MEKYASNYRRVNTLKSFINLFSFSILLIFNVSFSSTGGPNPPTLISPLNNSAGNSISPTLSWQMTSGAISYTLQVSTQSDFSNFVFNTDLTTVSQSFSGLLTNTTYYWRVSVKTSFGQSSWASASFTTNAGQLTQWSGTLPRPVLFVHGVNSDMSTWGVTIGDNYFESVACGGTGCIKYTRTTSCQSYRDGTVSSYKPGSAPQVLADKFGITLDGLVAEVQRTTNNGSPPYVYSTLATTKINHNGIEFYTSMAYSPSGITTGLSACSEDPVNAGDGTDPFATLNFTNGVQKDNVRNGNVYQKGQTDQVYEKLNSVLNEYFSDWKTNLTEFNNGNRNIDLVCHSQGCLAIRNMVAVYRSTGLDNPVNHINTIVSMDSPALGTGMALDGSGLTSIQSIRNIVFAIYKSGLIAPIDLGVTTIDPFEDIRKMLDNFYARQLELAYPNNYFNFSWQPSLSMLSTSGVSNGSSFMTNLSLQNIPLSKPINNVKIPLTAYYGLTPTLGTTLLNYEVSNGLHLCNLGAVSADEISWWIQGGLGFKTCTDWVNYIGDQFRPIFTLLDQQWSPYSDFVVDQSSQQYLGRYNSFNFPFVTKALLPSSGDLGVPHMNMKGIGANGSDLLGATMHGSEIADALAKPPKQLSMAPINLLLNQ